MPLPTTPCTGLDRLNPACIPVDLIEARGTAATVTDPFGTMANFFASTANKRHDVAVEADQRRHHPRPDLAPPGPRARDDRRDRGRPVRRALPHPGDHRRPARAPGPAGPRVRGDARLSFCTSVNAVPFGHACPRDSGPADVALCRDAQPAPEWPRARGELSGIRSRLSLSPRSPTRSGHRPRQAGSAGPPGAPSRG